MVVGGQHISAAVRKRYEGLLAEHWKEESIPVPIRFVHAEILRADTPVQLVRLAAGEHQRLQSERQDCCTEDVMRLLAQTLEKKRERHPTDWALTDNEIYVVVQTLGLAMESKLPTKGKQPSKKSVQEQMVCEPSPVPVSIHCLSTEGLLCPEVPCSGVFDVRCR